jgi:hypothetical protein
MTNPEEKATLTATASTAPAHSLETQSWYSDSLAADPWCWYAYLSHGILHCWMIEMTRPHRFDDSDNMPDDPVEMDRE